MPPLLQALLNDYCQSWPNRNLQIMEELVLRKGIEVIPSIDALLKAVPFDVSAIIEEGIRIIPKLQNEHFSGTIQITRDDLAFLPAPVVWLEWAEPYGGRVGALIENIGENVAEVRWIQKAGKGRLQICGMNAFLLRGSDLFHRGAILDCHELKGTEVADVAAERTAWLMAMLAFINSPKIIGRQQHLPHAGLQRKLAAAKGVVGKWPLQAWHEIKLEVRPPKEAGDALHEAHLTGERAQHFVRAHLRIRLGQLEFVSSHHRGNPALGIKQTKYRLVMPDA